MVLKYSILAHQMQNFLRQADVQPPKIILYTYTFKLI